MSTDKQLKVQVKSDLRDGAGLMKFLDQLAASGNKVAKSLSAINLGAGGGAGAIKGGLAKALLEQKNLFIGMGKAGSDLARTLNNEVSRSLEQLDRKLVTNEKHLTSAIEKHTKFAAALANISKASVGYGAAQGEVDKMRDIVDALAQRKTGLLNDAAGIAGNQNAPGGTGGGVGSGLLAGLSGVPGMAGIARLLGGGIGYAGMAAAPFAAAAMYANGMSSLYENRVYSASHERMIAADVGQSSGQNDLNIKYGDTSSTYWMNRAMKDRKLDAFALAKYQDAENDNGYFTQVFKHGNIIKGFTNAEDALLTANAEFNKAPMEFAGMLRNADPAMAAAVDYLKSNAGSDVANGFRAGMTPAAFRAKSASFSGSGVMPDEGASMLMGLISSGGRSAMGLAGSVVSARMSGMSPGIAASLAGAGLVGGTNILSALGGRGLDPTAREMLGQGAVGFMGPDRMLGSTSGLVDAISSGTDFSGNSAIQRRAVQQNIMGMGVGQNLFGGATPWQKTVNLINSVNTLSGGSIYAQNKLANLDFGSVVGLLNDKKALMPTELSAMGITRGALEGFASRTTSSSIGRWIDEGKSDRASVLARHIRQDFGGDIRKWGRTTASSRDTLGYSESNAKVLSSLLGQVDPNTFGGAGQALGGVRVLAGHGRTGDHISHGKGTGGSIEDDPTFFILKTQAHGAAEALDKVTEAAHGVAKALSTVAKERGSGAPKLPANPRASALHKRLFNSDFRE